MKRCSMAAWNALRFSRTTDARSRLDQGLLDGGVDARTRDPELTADLTAEVFAVVLEHAAQFDPGRAAGEHAAPWLFASGRNTLLKSLRRGRVAADARRRLRMTDSLA
jgi:DNA-directed RNA polymerase specialized sigma24 family protein